MELRYGLDDRPPAIEWISLGLQWFAVAVPSIIILGKIICFAGPEGTCDPMLYLQKLFFIAGLFMLVQIFLGHRLPLILGPSTVILIGILASPGADPEALHTSILAGGLVLAVLAATGLLGKIERLFTRRVTAVVLLLIAFTLMPTIIRLLTGSEGGVAPQVNILFGLLLSLSMLVLNRFLGGIWRSTLILSATVAGTIIYRLLFPGSSGIGLDGSAAFLAPFFTGLTTTLSFEPGLFMAFLVCFLALAINDMGSIESLNAIVPGGGMEERIRRGITVTGLANMVAGFLGVIGQVNYSLSPGVVASSRCLSRFALVPAAVLMLLVAFSPAAIAFMEAVPSVVVGSAMLYILCSQVAVGLVMLQEEGKPLGFSDGLVVAMPLLLAIIAAFLPPEVIRSFPSLIRPVAGNSFVMGVLTVLFLEHVLFRDAGKGPGS
jgi:xanthine/uracil permease